MLNMDSLLLAKLSQFFPSFFFFRQDFDIKINSQIRDGGNQLLILFGGPAAHACRSQSQSRLAAHL